MRIHLFGASGTGVTTLGQSLAAKLNIDYFDSDDYFWIQTNPPFSHKRNREERNSLLLTDLNSVESWILGGSILYWDDNLLSDCDLIVFLYVSKDTRLDRLKKRELERWGDLINKDPAMQKKSDDFIAWAADYDDNTGIATRTLEAHRLWLDKINKPVLEIAGDLTNPQRIDIIIDKLKEMKLLPSTYPR